MTGKSAPRRHISRPTLWMAKTGETVTWEASGPGLIMVRNSTSKQTLRNKPDVRKMEISFWWPNVRATRVRLTKGSDPETSKSSGHGIRTTTGARGRGGTDVKQNLMTSAVRHKTLPENAFPRWRSQIDRARRWGRVGETNHHPSVTPKSNYCSCKNQYLLKPDATEGIKQFK